MMVYLKLFRIPNILMIGLTMALMRYAIMMPILSVYHIELQLPFTAFLSYTLATMLVAAAGYIINDYFDRDLDIVNRPSQVIIGKKIPADKIMVLYWTLNIIAIIIAGYAAFKSGVFALVFCYPVMTGLLYFYSTTYKKQLLIGNIIVAIATSLVPLTVYLFEFPPVLHHYKYYIISGSIRLGVISAWILAFSAFAFLSGLAREIVKDMEDFEGDRFAGRNTVPLSWGMAWAKRISMALLLMVVAGLAVIYHLFFTPGGKPDFITLVYFSAFLVIPLVFNVYQLYRSKTVEDYKFCGDLLKLIMLAGILYSPVVWYIIHRTF